MKNNLKKSLMVLLAFVMVVTMAIPVAFAEGSANVEITFENAAMEAATGNGLRVTNMINSGVADVNKAVEGTYIEGGVITFKFSEEMDINTLTPENIIITLEGNSATYIKSTKYDAETKVWAYEPCAKTSNSYSISIADMCEGVMVHKVEFTDAVKTANGNSIVTVTKKFETGRISTKGGYEGRVLKDVAFGKTVTAEGAGTKVDNIVKYHSKFTIDSTNLYGQINNVWVKIDLGNYYDIADIMIRVSNRPNTTNVTRDMLVAYSCDPDATGDTATPLGTLYRSNYYSNGTGYEGDTIGGLGLSTNLNLSQPVRARYIFIKNTSASASTVCYVANLCVLSPVEADYGVITATKDGSAVNEFSGAGEYVVSVPVTEHVSGASNGYIIVAGYDETGVITNINCAPVSLAGGKLSLTTTFNSATKSLKAVLIKDFIQPQMLTDALVLETPAASDAE